MLIYKFKIENIILFAKLIYKISRKVKCDKVRMFRLHVQQNYFNFWLVLAADISINEIVVQHEVGKNIDGLRTLSRLEFKWD